jgi:hypothetical protein
MKYEITKGNPIIENVPTIGHLIYDDLGNEVMDKLNEEFKGTDIELKGFRNNQSISFSNVPRILKINNILRDITNNEIKVFSPEDAVRYLNKIPEVGKIYADTDSIAIYPNQGSNENLRKKVLNLIGKQKIKIPLIVSGLDIEKADNEYGFTFKETDYMKFTEAPFLTKNGSIIYNSKENKLEASLNEEGIKVWTRNDQEGLARLFLYSDSDLGACNDDLCSSDGGGRVVIKSAPGNEKN